MIRFAAAVQVAVGDFACDAAGRPARPAFEVASIKPHGGVITFSMDPQIHGGRVVGTAGTSAGPDHDRLLHPVRPDCGRARLGGDGALRHRRQGRRQQPATAGRPVLDKTGLEGYYAYTLGWFPANRPMPPGLDAPDMFQALQDQLGLRLESTKGPVEKVVIDHAEKPSGN